MKTTITILIWLIPVFVHAQSTSLPKCADPLGRAGVVYDPKKFACHEGRRYPIEFARCTSVDGKNWMQYDPMHAQCNAWRRPKSILEIPVPRVHSDVVGTIQAYGISEIALRMSINFLNRLSIATEPVHVLYQPNLGSHVIHDARFCATSL